ncbi:hypothetical protein COU16_00180 [Candidatus Kaiserbacteria bacterium CG10_big_fil_rev_8_21_14_0_10_47_16]|uniref:Cupin type-2 domain-containing protein n=1 Tax=Candidatus Kaiserbacteria bacterium CG10_big_fil_rev_8_21_14_0_10_47_16 TaxID=1974608 RepID=A0A2H0UES7_9BACT|nr:MAG: hypothetical protein COU16_00180 [Candidatus Kaiserbacteria bacterium CG10_big_fil_rev_8_21_14_0_10_47_16]
MESNLITIKKITPVFKDERGEIFDIFEAPVGHTGLITFTQGAARAGHYHIESIQYSYVLEGEIELIVSQQDGSEEERFTLKPNMYAEIPAGVVHTYIAKTEALMLDSTTLSRNGDGYEKDTVRVPVETVK